MNTSSNSYVLGFTVIICVTMSALLAVLATVLKPIQQASKELDRQKNVLMAAGLAESDSTPDSIRTLYTTRVEELVFDTSEKEVSSDKTSKDVEGMSKEGKRRFRVLARIKAESGDEVIGYVLPISGKGLWSILYGYLALAGDGNTVQGITFYQHGETPGLGGEVENPEWQAGWKGKKILSDGELVSITVKKGAVDESVERERLHQVDGLSGATITCKGVTDFVKADLTAFEPFLQKVWSK
jgi:Na+-transporting NADH:ubiquinone oxidoreductase subunit C